MRHSNRRSEQSRREKKEIRGRQVTRHAHEEQALVKPVTPKGNFQKSLLNAINHKDAVFVNAPAGTGKTYVVMSTVIDWLKQGKIKKIVLSRPTVGMGNSLGLLPGY